MIFFISIIIVAILYFLQADGLVYVTIIALIGELVNILMIHTMTKAIEKKAANRTQQVVEKFQKRIKENNKTIKELEKVRDESVRKLFAANKKIQDYEEQLGENGQEEVLTGNGVPVEKMAGEPEAGKPDQKTEPEKLDPKPEAEPEPEPDKPNGEGSKKEEFTDLPSGSNRRKRPV
ncbi:hypothetical protein [Desulfospira joergensenii]|uniref:hypothetical protein n=1 Tax=Desulfospira joergensenii TaxID=53329 RepID=UPI0003B42C12|nr:hypothetical protein [Desulfospira joergensenii]